MQVPSITNIQRVTRAASYSLPLLPLMLWCFAMIEHPRSQKYLAGGEITSEESNARITVLVVLKVSPGSWKFWVSRDF